MEYFNRHMETHRWEDALCCYYNKMTVFKDVGMDLRLVNKAFDTFWFKGQHHDFDHLIGLSIYNMVEELTDMIEWARGVLYLREDRVQIFKKLKFCIESINWGKTEDVGQVPEARFDFTYETFEIK